MPSFLWKITAKVSEETRKNHNESKWKKIKRKSRDHYRSGASGINEATANLYLEEGASAMIVVIFTQHY